MEIIEIKQQLTIGQVLDHYGLKTNTHNMLCCPFHEDKTPSLQIYRQTNTWTCFSSNCDAGSGDVIDFIMRMEKSTKHEAIVKAKELAGYNAPEPPYEKLFKTFLTNVKKADKAQAYLKERGLNPERLGIGYNNTTWGQMRYCLIFPLKSKQGKIVSLYGSFGRQALLHPKQKRTLPTLARTGHKTTDLNGSHHRCGYVASDGYPISVRDPGLLWNERIYTGT